jgi:hypothetical protein
MTSKVRVAAGLIILALSFIAGLARPKEPVHTTIAASTDGSREPGIQRPRPPRHLKVGQVVYTVETVAEVPGAGENATFSGRTCDRHALTEGWCETTDHIYLLAGLPLEQEQATLLHEIQHSILGTDASARKATYHEFIYQLSPKLLQVLKENPDLYAYLTANPDRPQNR